MWANAAPEWQDKEPLLVQLRAGDGLFTRGAG